MIRQGDVLVKRVEALPAGAELVPPEGGRVILAHGEVTGHAHALPAETVQMWSVGEQRYIEVGKVSTLTHEEHGPHTLEPGVYEVIRQREYSPEEIRFVVD